MFETLVVVGSHSRGGFAGMTLLKQIGSPTGHSSMRALGSSAMTLKALAEIQRIVSSRLAIVERTSLPAWGVFDESVCGREV
ncbi:MAG TPA: hypothetical protein VE197_18100 [Mycobacterium sp.]|nr:hypothetical protein [Mycobacterium sp.]